MEGDKYIVLLLTAFFVGFVVYLAIRSRREDRAARAAGANTNAPAPMPKAEAPPAAEDSKPLRRAS